MAAGNKRARSPSGPASDDAKKHKKQKPSSPLPDTKKNVGLPNSSLDTTATDDSESPALRPRKLKRNPTGHGQRLPYLKKVHEFMQSLNAGLKGSSDSQLSSLALEPSALVKMAVDEEARIAEESPKVYPNVIKQRMKELWTMTVQDWAKSLGPAHASAPAAEELKREHLLELLKESVASLHGLEEHGYMTSPPSDKEMDDVNKLLAVTGGYETCARCTSRFCVYSERNEDGALTSGGACRYHWGRFSVGQDEAKTKTFGCCGGIVGQAKGCETADSHVFKMEDAARLALSLQFMETPDAEGSPKSEALAMDCEMVYTTLGMELIRVTALDWPSGKTQLDVLVRPMGSVLCLNTRFSGVTADMLAQATPYGQDSDDAGVRLVESPTAARELLYGLVGPDTVLIGHGIENDLKAMRMVHPTIVDTVLLDPHFKGLPYRKRLVQLAMDHLNRAVQTGGAAGHDSQEDALVTGDVVKFLLQKRWQKMVAQGWTVDDEGHMVHADEKPAETTKTEKPEQTEQS